MRKSGFWLKLVLALGLLGNTLLLAACENSEDVGQLPESDDIAAGATASVVLDTLETQQQERHDKYAIYYTADEYAELLREVTGSYSGIGIYVYPDDATGRAMVYGVMKNGPAYKAGILPGDVFLEVNGEDLGELDYEAVSEKLTSYPEGTKLRLLLERKFAADTDDTDEKSLDENSSDEDNAEDIEDDATETVTVEVRTAKVDIPTLDYKMLDDGMGLIRIESFNMTTGEQFDAAYDELVSQGMQGLIIDLRNNGGGEVMAALHICDYFVPKGDALMYIVDSTGTYYYSAAKQAVDMPLVILQNGHSASASEILIGAVHDNEAGVTIGETSYGKGIVQDLVQLKSGAGLRFTSAQYKTSHNNYIHGCGIDPDIYYPMPEDADPLAMYSMDVDSDPQLVKACETLQGLMTGESDGESVAE